MDWFAASFNFYQKGQGPRPRAKGHTLHRTTLSLLFITVTSDSIPTHKVIMYSPQSPLSLRS